MTCCTVITAFMAAHQLPDVTVVADAGMISEVNQHAIEDAWLSFILGTRRFLCRYPDLFRVVRDLRCDAAPIRVSPDFLKVVRPDGSQ